MEKILAAWNLKTVQEYLNICQHLRDNGKTEADVRDYLENPEKYNISPEKNDTPASIIEKKCEQSGCQGMMELYTVCCSDATKKKEGYFTKWECKDCSFVEYDKRTLAEIKGELNA